VSELAILRREAYVRVPWPNGGGITDDILVDPGPAPARRISLATIQRDGPFSDFTGYDRDFVVATGAGVALQHAGAEPVVLDRIGMAHAFRGETPTTAALLDGPVQAFNVFTRRTAVRAHVALRRIAAGEAWSPPPGAGYAFVLSGTLDSPAGALRAHDTLALASGTAELRAREAALVVHVTFRSAEDGR
jgi:environmental stress-induced protein Ves